VQLAIVTAAITSSFVERARQRELLRAGDRADIAELAADIADIKARLEQIQRALDLSVPAQVAADEPDSPDV
jgi:hypothetical protein